jgi:anaphase-promoting complex subunit 5
MTLPRYLTAQKVSLLVLVNLYCNSVLPSSATIPVLSFILSHSISTVPSNARSGRSVGYDDASISIEAFEHVLQSHASSMPGRTLLDVFLKHMWEMNSFDALHKLFDNIGDLLLKSREDGGPDTSTGEFTDRVLLSKTSPLGVFVRRARLEFTRLQFDDTMKLWSTFIVYRAPTAQWTKRLAGLASSGADSVTFNMGLQPGDDLYEAAYGHLAQEEEKGTEISVDDFDRLLEFQLDKLQRESSRALSSNPSNQIQDSVAVSPMI